MNVLLIDPPRNYGGLGDENGFFAKPLVLYIIEYSKRLDYFDLRSCHPSVRLRVPRVAGAGRRDRVGELGVLRSRPRNHSHEASD